MRFLFILSLSLCICLPIHAGCGGISCTTSNGIYINYMLTYLNKAGVNGEPTFQLKLASNGQCGIKSFTVFYNNTEQYQFSPPYYYTAPPIITLEQKPGIYRIDGKRETISDFSFEFQLLPNAVGLEDLTGTNVDFLTIYPNPAEEQITLSNETEELKTIVIYNSNGVICGDYEIKQTTITIPLTHLAPGIYFMHVATLSDKVVIKKIVIL